ncbi:hypothetical protein Ancab_012917 [Ancistrocladus abbreviatus]
MENDATKTESTDFWLPATAVSAVQSKAGVHFTGFEVDQLIGLRWEKLPTRALSGWTDFWPVLNSTMHLIQEQFKLRELDYLLNDFAGCSHLLKAGGGVFCSVQLCEVRDKTRLLCLQTLNSIAKSQILQVIVSKLVVFQLHCIVVS